MYVRYGTRKHRNYPMLTDIVFVRQDAKKECRWIVDDFFQVTGCQMTVQPAFECADSAFFFCSFNTVVFFVFFRMSAECPSRFFVKFVAGLATTCPVKEKLVTKTWVQLGDAHP